MNYTEVFDGKKYNEFSNASVYSAASQDFQPVVLDLSGKKQKEIPLYYENTEVLTFTQCFLMLLVLLVPFAGPGYLIYLAFQKGERSPKKTLAQALLAFYLLLAAVVVFAGLL